MKKFILSVFKYSILILFGIGYSFVLLGSITDVINYPDAPLPVTLGQALELKKESEADIFFFDKPLYVTITDWHCISFEKQGFRYKKNTRDKRNTDAFFTNPDDTILIFAEVHGWYSCDELMNMEIAGEIHTFTKRPVEFTNLDGEQILITDPNTYVLSLCTHCNRSEAWTALIFFILFPFLMWGIFEIGKRNEQQQTNHSQTKST